MQYTLDSIEHVKECFIKKFPEKKVSYNPLYTTDLSILTKDSKQERSFYFGVLVVGDNCKAKIYSEGVLIITINNSNQIIKLFNSIQYTDLSDNDITSGMQGDFRGFEIIVH